MIIIDFLFFFLKLIRLYQDSVKNLQLSFCEINDCRKLQLYCILSKSKRKELVMLNQIVIKQEAERPN